VRVVGQVAPAVRAAAMGQAEVDLVRAVVVRVVAVAMGQVEGLDLVEVDLVRAVVVRVVAVAMGQVEGVVVGAVGGAAGGVGVGEAV